MHIIITLDKLKHTVIIKYYGILRNKQIRKRALAFIFISRVLYLIVGGKNNGVPGIKGGVPLGEATSYIVLLLVGM